MKKKYLALLLAAALGTTMLTGCGRKPEPTTDEAILLLMEREILRRDHGLPPEYIQYHAEHGIPVEEEETAGLRTILKEVGRYLPDDVNDYISQADQLMQDVGDVASQAQSMLDQLDSGAGKDLVDQFTSGAGKDLVDQFTSGEGREILDDLTSGEAGDLIDELTSGEGRDFIDGLTGGESDQGGSDTMDGAVYAYAAGIYHKNIEEWRGTLPAEALAQHPDYAEKSADIFAEINPEEKLPGGLESLTYEVERDITDAFLEGGEEATSLKNIYASYGVKNIDGVWAVRMNFESGEDDTLIVRSDGRYYATYAMAFLRDLYGEDYDGCMY